MPGRMPVTGMPERKRAIAVDLDGTLAMYDGYKGAEFIGDPVPEMVAKVKAALAQGDEIWIFTARVNPKDQTWQASIDATKAFLAIAAWCQKNLGMLLPITHEKMVAFTDIFDDRCQQVIPNTGVFLGELMEAVK